jgi:hypothetical protein
MAISAREEVAADEGFKDGFDGATQYKSFKPLSSKERKEYDDQYTVGVKAKQEQLELHRKILERN